MLFESVSEYRSLVARVDSRTQKSCTEHITIYPGLGQFGPYVQQLIAPKIGGLQQSVKEQDLVSADDEA
jgi:hypothetical protein